MTLCTSSKRELVRLNANIVGLSKAVSDENSDDDFMPNKRAQVKPKGKSVGISKVVSPKGKNVGLSKACLVNERRSDPRSEALCC